MPENLNNYSSSRLDVHKLHTYIMVSCITDYPVCLFIERYAEFVVCGALFVAAGWH